MDTCTVCGEPIEQGTKYLCIYKTFRGFRLEIGCAHHTPPQEDRIATLGSADCFHGWIAVFEDVSLYLHPEKEQ